jgi:hypothetical protein
MGPFEEELNLSTKLKDVGWLGLVLLSIYGVVLVALFTSQPSQSPVRAASQSQIDIFSKHYLDEQAHFQSGGTT